MSEVNFAVKQDALAVVQNTAIEANFEECKAALSEMIAPYKAMVINPDDIAAAKNDRARIRKVAARVDEVRKTVKRAYTEPLAEFELRCKELVAICNEGSDNLDRQIKDFEEREANDKIANLHEKYAIYATEETADYCPWERVYNEKWRNKGYKAEDAVEEIKAALYQTAMDIKSIREWACDDTPYLLDIYKQSHDLNAVIRKAHDLKMAREREAQRRRDEEALKHPEQAYDVVGAYQREQEQKRASIEPVIASASATTGNLVTVDFRVYCTKEQLTALGQYMKDNGIKYGRVPHGD